MVTQSFVLLTPQYMYVSLGIGNVEEFSLLVEGQKEEKEELDKMGTAKRVCF